MHAAAEFSALVLLALLPLVLLLQLAKHMVALPVMIAHFLTAAAAASEALWQQPQQHQQQASFAGPCCLPSPDAVVLLLRRGFSFHVTKVRIAAMREAAAATAAVTVLPSFAGFRGISCCPSKPR